MLESVSTGRRDVITLGDKARTAGFGPFLRFVPCDFDMPARDLPSRAYPLAERRGDDATYVVNLHDSMSGYSESADGTIVPIEELRGRAHALSGVCSYELGAEETLYIHHGALTLQARYVRRTPFIPPPLARRYVRDARERSE